MEYTLKSGNVEINKIKAIRPQIIVTGTVEKPYYEILYYDISDKTWHIGYSSYNLANVIKWKEECFEVVGEIEDMQPTADVEEVKHGEWVYKHRHRGGFERKTVYDDFNNPHTITIDNRYECDEPYCSVCGKLGGDFLNYCGNCGAKMDVRYAE